MSIPNLQRLLLFTEMRQEAPNVLYWGAQESAYVRGRDVRVDCVGVVHPFWCQDGSNPWVKGTLERDGEAQSNSR